MFWDAVCKPGLSVHTLCVRKWENLLNKELPQWKLGLYHCTVTLNTTIVAIDLYLYLSYWCLDGFASQIWFQWIGHWDQSRKCSWLIKPLVTCCQQPTKSPCTRVSSEPSLHGLPALLSDPLSPVRQLRMITRMGINMQYPTIRIVQLWYKSVFLSGWHHTTGYTG